MGAFDDAGSRRDFDALDQAWGELVSAGAAGLVHDWRGEIRSMTSEHDRLVAAGRWTEGRADMLAILGRARMELDHSALLAWALDPLAAHAMGTRLLQRFLAGCWPGGAFTGLERARVQTEVTRNEARADVVVTAPGLCVVIEVKVDAQEGWAQCDAYVRHWGQEPGARFVFLTPNGRRPTTDPQGVFVPWSWRALRGAFASVVAQARDEGRPVSPTLEQWIETLQREFP